MGFSFCRGGQAEREELLRREKKQKMASRKIDNRQKKVVTPKREYGKDRGHFQRQKQAQRGQRRGVPKR